VAADHGGLFVVVAVVSVQFVDSCCF